MADVVVYFAHPGKPATDAEQGVIAAHTGQTVSWYFISWDANIEFARIEFDDHEANFFPQAGGYTNTVPVVNGSASMTGTVPAPVAPGDLTVKSYAIKALNHDQQSIDTYTIDPDVVTVDP